MDNKENVLKEKSYKFALRMALLHKSEKRQAIMNPKNWTAKRDRKRW
jgi:hypothetical protein